jgi:hypothetical protein
MFAGKLQTGRAAGAEKIGMALVGSYHKFIIAGFISPEGVNNNGDRLV